LVADLEKCVGKDDYENNCVILNNWRAIEDGAITLIMGIMIYTTRMFK